VQDGNWGSVDSVGNWSSVVGWGVNHRGSVVSWGVSHWGSIVVGLSLVGHISNITVIVVGVVGHMLDSAVGKVDGVRSSNNTVAVIVLLLLESGTAVVISHGVGVLVGRGLAQVISNISGLHWGVVGGGSVVGGGGVHGMVDGGVHGMSNNWSVVDSVVDWGMDGMMDWGMDGMMDGGMDSVVDWGMDSVVDWGMDGVSENWGMDGVVDGGVDGMVTNNSISSVKSVGGISDDSGVSTEGLALGGGPVLSLVGLAH